MLNQIIRFIGKLVLITLGLIFAFSMLAAALVVVLLSLIKSLITGKKSSPVMGFNRFKKFSPFITWSSTSNPASNRDQHLKVPPSGEIVDVDVREIKDVNDLNVVNDINHLNGVKDIKDKT